MMKLVMVTAAFWVVGGSAFAQSMSVPVTTTSGTSAATTHLAIGSGLAISGSGASATLTASGTAAATATSTTAGIVSSLGGAGGAAQLDSAATLTGNTVTYNGAPVSLATIASLAELSLPASKVGAASGVAQLDSGSHLVAGQLPTNVPTLTNGLLSTSVEPAGWAADIALAATAMQPGAAITCAELTLGANLSCSGNSIVAAGGGGSSAATATTTTAGTVPNLGGNSGAAETDGTGHLIAGEFPALTGAVTSAAGSTTTTLATTGVTAGTYPKVTVGTDGRITSGAALAVADLPASVLTTALENTASGIPTLTSGLLACGQIPLGTGVTCGSGGLTAGSGTFTGGTITGATSVVPTANVSTSLTVGLPTPNGYASAVTLPRATDSGTGDVTQAGLLDIEDYNYATYGQYCCGINNGKASIQINRYLGSGSAESATGVTVNLQVAASHAFADEDVDFNAQVNKTGSDSSWGFSGQTNDLSGLPPQSFSALGLEYDINANGMDNPASAYDAQDSNRWFIYLGPKVYGWGGWAASTTESNGAVIVATSAGGVSSIYKASPLASTTASAASAAASTTLTVASATSLVAGQTIQDTVTGATATISSLSGTTLTLNSGGFTLPHYAGSTSVAVSSGDAIVTNTAGTTGTTAPTWPNSGTVTDGTVVWTYEETNAVEVGTAIWLDNGEASNTSYGSGLGTNGHYLNAVIDTSLATLVNAGTAAIRVGYNQPIDLSGNNTAAGQNQHTLELAQTAGPSSTPELVYAKAGNPTFLIQDTNNYIQNYGLAGLGVYNSAGITTGWDTVGTSFGWNESNGTQESDIVISPGGLNVYTVSSTGTISSPALTMSAAGTLMSIGGLKLPIKTVATLPTCNAAEDGTEMAVSDATSPSYNGALMGSGSVTVPVFCGLSGATYGWTTH